MLDSRSECVSAFDLEADTKSSMLLLACLVQAQKALGLVSDGRKCLLLLCDFAPTKCTPMTNELTDSVPLLHRNMLEVL